MVDTGEVNIEQASNNMSFTMFYTEIQEDESNYWDEQEDQMIKEQVIEQEVREQNKVFDCNNDNSGLSTPHLK